MTKTQDSVCLITSALWLEAAPAETALNPSLKPIAGKAAITHFIERLGEQTPFLVAITADDWGKQVKDYLSLAHPLAKVSFITPERGACFDGDPACVPVDPAVLEKTVAESATGFDFSKSDEALFFVGKRVIKFFADERIAALRVRRAGSLPEVFPPLIKRAGKFYAYEYQEGDTLYHCLDERKFESLLAWADRAIWAPLRVDAMRAKAAAQEFYEAKTRQRVAAYFRKYELRDAPSTINGKEVATTTELLNEVPWASLSDCYPVFMHGDFQLDNILFDRAKDRFVLLDWRQDFGGESEFGDIYYDLAKLYASLWVDYNAIKQNRFSYEERGDVVRLRYEQVSDCLRYLKCLEVFVGAKGLSFEKVKWLSALVYLNMAPLHCEPFDKLLYSLGRELLAYNSAASRVD